MTDKSPPTIKQVAEHLLQSYYKSPEGKKETIDAMLKHKMITCLQADDLRTNRAKICFNKNKDDVSIRANQNFDD